MKVFLVGAGPGDPGLITVKGRKALEQADCVLYDHLASDRLLDLAPAHAERIYVGKKRSDHEVTQDEIETILIERARQFPGQEKAIWDYYRKTPDALASLRAPIFEEKVVDHVIGQTKVTDKVVTKEELMKPDDDEA